MGTTGRSGIEQPDLFTQLQPQSATKHDILRKYAGAWAKILSNARWCNHAWVVDAFAGQGRYDDGNPGSPLILAEELITWQRLRQTDRPNFRFHLRLVEREHRDELAQVVSEIPADLDVQICPARTFREALPALVADIGDDPAFYFIDPTGWVGAEFDLVETALAGRSKEALINFLYDSISEWSGAARQRVEEHEPDPQVTGLIESLNRFFGTSVWIDVVLEDPGPRMKEERLLGVYARQLRERGFFAWPFRNKYPGKERTYYYLIHATRNITGLKIMKELMVSKDLAPPTLFDEMRFEDFTEELRLRFGGGGPVREGAILAYVLQDTEYLESHMRRALADLGAVRERGRVGQRTITVWRIP